MLSNDQANAKQAITAWLTTDKPVMVLSGYAGTGKSTLMKDIMEDWETIEDTHKQNNPEYKRHDLVFTATTNKAVSALRHVTGCHDVVTIHSILKLRVKIDKDTGESSLIRRESAELRDTVLVIDEASYIDELLLQMILETPSVNTKILFIGDPTQLTPVKCNDTPVFNKGFPTVYLTEIKRQASDSLIPVLAEGMRNFILGKGEFPSFETDEKTILWLDLPEFRIAMLNEFARMDWKPADSKALAYTNKTVISMNKFVSTRVTGIPDLCEGDLVVNNRYIRGKTTTVRTDETVEVFSIHEGEYDINGTIYKGHYVQVDYGGDVFFMPAKPKDYDKALNSVLGTHRVYELQSRWIDLRAAYACTVNKSQGSTYHTVFIDLTDIAVTKSWDHLARLIYVALTRASHKVIFTGDI